MATTTSKIQKGAKRVARQAVAGVAKKSDLVVAKQRRVVERELDGLLATLTGKIQEVRDAVVTAADDGAVLASRGLDRAVVKSRGGIKKLEKRWRKMDTNQKAGVIGGLLAALAAAAAAPSVIRRVRGR